MPSNRTSQQEKRTVLVTGGAGFIGVNFVHYWMKQHPGDKIIVLDALTYAGNKNNLPMQSSSNYLFIHGSILDSSLLTHLFKEETIDTVIHFAAETHVDRSIHHPEDFLKTNVMGTYCLLETVLRAWPKNNNSYRFHHISTDEVYGSLNADDSPFTENSIYKPNSPYSASKAASDHLVRAYYHTYQLPITISHCSNNYGPYQHPEKFIPTVIRSCHNWKPIPIYGNGSNIRDWLHVEDHCSAIDLILQYGKIGETYNIGGNHEISNSELVNHICQIMDCIQPKNQSYQSLISFVDDRPGHDWRYAIDISKIKSELSFTPTIKFTDGIIATIQHYLQNPELLGLDTKLRDKMEASK